MEKARGQGLIERAERRIYKIENELKIFKAVVKARDSQILQLVKAYAILIQTESKVS